MKYAIATNKVVEVPNGYSVGVGERSNIWGIDTPKETTIAHVEIVDAESPIDAINQVLTCCPDFSEDNDVDGLVKWLGMINIVMSVPVPVETT